jgi:DNA polymerase-4
VRSVVHWDGDSFFASIEQASDRRLRGRPVAVGGARRGVVVSASREARRFGVRPGMPANKARRACPPLIVVPGRFDLYEQFSEQIIGLCEEATPLVEPVAVGAAYLDLTGAPAVRREGPAPAVRELRRTVRDWLHVSLSAGIGANKTVARIAARLRKPGNQLSVPAGGEAAFLAPLPLRWLPGIRPRVLGTLEVAGLARIGHLARAPLDALELVLGRQALPLQRRAQGIDEEPVGLQMPREPVWRESMEFAEDVWEEPFLLVTLRSMLERVLARVRSAGVEVRRLTLSLRYTDRAESQRSLTLPQPSAVEEDFFPLLPGLLRAAWKRRVRLRSLALSAGLVYRPAAQMSLFDTAPPRPLVKLAVAIDSLRRKFGPSAIVRGYEMESDGLRRSA